MTSKSFSCYYQDWRARFGEPGFIMRQQRIHIEEIKALEENQTWTIEDLPPEKDLLL